MRISRENKREGFIAMIIAVVFVMMLISGAEKEGPVTPDQMDAILASINAKYGTQMRRATPEELAELNALVEQNGGTQQSLDEPENRTMTASEFEKHMRGVAETATRKTSEQG